MKFGLMLLASSEPFAASWHCSSLFIVETLIEASESLVGLKSQTTPLALLIE